jgi:hypothetical protein
MAKCVPTTSPAARPPGEQLRVIAEMPSEPEHQGVPLAMARPLSRRQQIFIAGIWWTRMQRGRRLRLAAAGGVRGSKGRDG